MRVLFLAFALIGLNNAVAAAPICRPTVTIEPKILDLAGYNQTFISEFSSRNISDFDGSGPWFVREHQYYGDAKFKGIEAGDDTYSLIDGKLRIRLQNKDGVWQSGLVQSMNRSGTGFRQSLGYFEITAKLPKEKSAWPAFWLKSAAQYLEPNSNFEEIDAFEIISAPFKKPRYHMAAIQWRPDRRPAGITQRIQENVCDLEIDDISEFSEKFRRYGVELTEKNIIFYLDRKEVGRLPASELTLKPVFITLSLAYRSEAEFRSRATRSDFVIDSVAVWKKEK